MRTQTDSHSCGVFAVVNAAKVLGVRLSVKEVRKHSGTTEDGTTQHGILNALERLGLKGTPFMWVDKREAYHQVLESVKDFGNPVILCVEDDRHWVVIIGAAGKRVVSFDSWNSQDNMKENGIDLWDERSLSKWWTKTDGYYYGIVVEKA